ncbi:NAD-reducing hydrogenase subunit HoxY [Candidatus Promineifilum breve]|jgi:NAD-reducing hydrogenase small subunit|uniref:NAD-reducing hydrogenase subunit HoxY n=1 Tax=Candidatus Promineifilum breve TaxID=1806508 RepID=A0A160SYI7_9CHLR|nr:NAD-reducing hydrogenase subunit HoxY [Candidatus Promineifilum breve]
MSNKPTLATVWLDGCSGCHMSFLDIDERILDLAAQADLVYSPLVDAKEFPDMVDITLIEGAVSSEDDYNKIRKVRAHTRLLVSLGDCAVTANVPAMRNRFSVKSVLDRAYIENAALNQHIPVEVIPALRRQSVPVHQIVPVDVFIPGCPPSADIIFFALTELLAGRMPDLRTMTRFGA